MVKTPLNNIYEHVEIENILKRCAFALDHQYWDVWDDSFSDDATIDFTHLSGRVGTPSAFKERLSKKTPLRISGQHNLTNITVWVNGESVMAHSEFLIENADKTNTLGFIERTTLCGYYKDEFIKINGAWKIAKRQGFLNWKETRLVKDEVSRDTSIS